VHPRPADAVAAGQAGQVGEGAAAGVGGVGVEDRADLVQRPADLVVPLGPRKPVTMPGRTSNDNRSTAVVSP
jgi:hypothetical protein